MHPRRAEGALLFLAPLTRGGRGGWFYPLRAFFNKLLRVNSDQGGVVENPSSLEIHPAPLGFDSAFPRICGYRPASGCGRISGKERRGDVLMDERNPSKGKRRPAPHQGRPADSVRPATLLPAIGINPPALVGFYLLRPGTEREGRAANFDKIPKNKINIAKFTGFFDKKRKRENIATRCNKTIYFIYLSRGDSKTATNFFHAPQLPAFAMNCAALPAFARNRPQEGPAGRRGEAKTRRGLPLRRRSRVIRQPPKGK